MTAVWTRRKPANSIAEVVRGLTLSDLPPYDEGVKRPGEDWTARRPRCPTCGRPVDSAGNPARPFCSPRCQLVDLGVWLDGRYRLPGPPLGEARPAEGAPEAASNPLEDEE
jgi:endogenous inhibitor of DNA gyrase (YacG/DUF329 family)